MWRNFLLLVLVLCLLPKAAQQFTLMQQCDALQRRADIQVTGANVLLGGLFSIREANGQGCGLPSSGKPYTETMKLKVIFLCLRLWTDLPF